MNNDRVSDLEKALSEVCDALEEEINNRYSSLCQGPDNIMGPDTMMKYRLEMDIINNARRLLNEGAAITKKYGPNSA